MRVLAALLFLAFALPAQALATFPGENGPIAFVSSRAPDGNADIYVMRADGSGQTRLTAEPGEDFNSVWSPGGDRIAFCSDRASTDSIEFHLYLMEADGSDVRRLGTPQSNECGLAFAPGGRRVVFSSDAAGGPDLFVVNLDGSGLRRLTRGRASDVAPDWSPGGRRIAFVRDGDIWVMNADGTRKRKVAGTPLSVSWNPSWSPDGRRLVFDDDRATGEIDPTPEIWIVHADGTGLRRLTRNHHRDFQPVWSPDGRRVLFVSDRDGLDHLFSIRPNGSGLRRLTNTDATYAPGDYQPSWARLPLRAGAGP